MTIEEIIKISRDIPAYADEKHSSIERPNITKEALIICYNTPIKQSKEENENVTSETSND